MPQIQTYLTNTTDADEYALLFELLNPIFPRTFFMKELLPHFPQDDKLKIQITPRSLSAVNQIDIQLMKEKIELSFQEQHYDEYQVDMIECSEEKVSFYVLKTQNN